MKRELTPVLRAIAVLIALLPAVAIADMTGQASVIDGDTIEIHGQRIRLHGIGCSLESALAEDMADTRVR